MFNITHLASVYAHPLEFVFGNSFPSLAGMFILKSRIHVVTFLGWTIFRFIETHEGHSGLEFPISMFSIIPFSAGSKYHNYHHLKNQGNYASFTTIWDRIFGTNETYLNVEEEKVKQG